MKKTKNPKVSVVTISFNSENYIQETIDSVDSQDYNNIEYIIIDGDSSDKTIDIIKDNKDKISFWNSEKDIGIFDAMNKSLQYCNGDWVIFMNSGDKFYDISTVSKVVPYLNAVNDIVYGDSEVLYDDYSIVKKAKSVDNLWKGVVCSHQSLFSRLEILKEKKFRTGTISSDFRFTLSCFKDGYKFKKLDFPISSVSPEGVSDKNQIKVLISWKGTVNNFYNGPKIEIYYGYQIFKTYIKKFIKNIAPKNILNFVRKIKDKFNLYN